MRALSAIKQEIHKLVGTPCPLKMDTKGRALLFSPKLSENATAALTQNGYHVWEVPGGLCIDPAPALWERLFTPLRQRPKQPEAISLHRLLDMHKTPLPEQNEAILRQGLILLYRTPSDAFFSFVGKAIADSLRENSPVPSHLGILLEIGGF